MKKPAAPKREGGSSLEGRELGKFAEFGFDRVEIRKVARAVVDLGVLDDPGFIDEESGAFGNPAHDKVLFGEELIVGDAIGFRSLMIVVGKELEANTFLFSPCCLGKWIISGNSENFAVQISVSPKTGGDVAKLLRADTGEGHRDEKD